jgi:starch synthase
VQILHISSEIHPYAKTGGLADVASALPRALAALPPRDRVAVVTPRYRADPERYGLARRLASVPVEIGPHFFELGVFEGRLPGGGGRVQAWLIDHPLFDRPGLYGEDGHDYVDNALRFALLSRGALAVARSLGFYPDVLHAHDWQSAPALLYARRGAHPNARTVFSIHNIAYQGQFPPSVVPDLGLGPDLFHPEGIEFWGNVSYLKAGIHFADWITTVSPTYAREIQTQELGCGMDGLLRSRAPRLVGILNGADYDVWSPSHDAALAAPYSGASLDGKRACKAALQRELGLPPRPRLPLVGAVSRLSHQKGIDLLADALEELLPAVDAQFALLGAGDRAVEERLVSLAARHPGRLAVRLGYDDPLAHRIYAGADLFVMPSRYEPCGLAQLYALRYGTPPVVRATGGLDDTVVEHDAHSRSGTGFRFTDFSSRALAAALRRAFSAFSDEAAFSDLQRRCMAQDFSWHRAAQSYRDLYLRA